jgi:hypothetical protein
VAVELSGALVDVLEDVPTGGCEVNQRRTSVLRIGLEARQSVLNGSIRDPLYGLSGDAEPSGHLRDRELALRDDAQELPSRLGLALGGRQRLA